MNPIIFSFLIILSFSIGGFLGFLAGNGSLVVTSDLATWIGALATLLGALATVGTLYFAKQGVDSWKKQHALSYEEKLLVSINQLLVDTYNLVSMLDCVNPKYDNIDSFIFNNLIMSVMKMKAAYRIYRTVDSNAGTDMFKKLFELQKILTRVRNNLLNNKSDMTIHFIRKDDIPNCRNIIEDIEQLIIQITNKNKL